MAALTTKPPRSGPQVRAAFDAALARRIDSPRFLRVETFSPRNVLHAFRLSGPGEVDAEFAAWLARLTGSAPRSTCGARLLDGDRVGGRADPARRVQRRADQEHLVDTVDGT